MRFACSVMKPFKIPFRQSPRDFAGAVESTREERSRVVTVDSVKLRYIYVDAPWNRRIVGSPERWLQVRFLIDEPRIAGD